MAYDKIITIRARLDDCLRYIQDGEKTALSLALDYIEDSGKTTLDDEVILQSAINCTLETCYQDMQHTKERFGKPGGAGRFRKSPICPWSSSSPTATERRTPNSASSGLTK